MLLFFTFLGIGIIGIIILIIADHFGKYNLAGDMIFVGGIGFLGVIITGMLMISGILGNVNSFKNKYDDVQYAITQLETYGCDIDENSLNYTRGVLNEIYDINRDIAESKRNINSPWIGKMYRKEIAEMTPLTFNFSMLPTKESSEKK